MSRRLAGRAAVRSLALPFSVLVLLFGVAGCGGGPVTGSLNLKPPDVTIDSPTEGQKFKPGVTVSFKGKVSDQDPVDSDPTKLDDVQWVINGSIASGAYSKTVPGIVSSTGDVVGSVDALEEGNYTVTLTAKDSDGKTGQANRTFVMINQAPTIGCVTAQPASVDPGQDVLFTGCTGSAADSDPDDPAQSLRITLADSNGSPYYQPTRPNDDGSWSITAQFFEPGQHTVYARVTDSAGKVGQSSPLLISVNDCDDADIDQDGFTSCEGDCNDSDAAVNPGAPEVCADSVDNDCDGQIDSGADQDGDGYDPCDADFTRIDCDDQNPATYPGAVELCNGTDNNCDGILNEEDTDGDGYRRCGGDCDDADPASRPGAAEICDKKDNNCDTLVPTGEQDADKDGVAQCEGDCSDNDPAIFPGGTEICSDSKDNNCNGLIDEDSDTDKDGFRTCGTKADCNDNNVAIYPGAKEGPDADKDGIADCDGVDNDCDGTVDNDTSCRDDDEDGWVELKNGYNGLKGGDCDDYNPYSFPGAIERSDFQDNNCDNQLEGILPLANAHVRMQGDLASGLVGASLSAGNDINRDDVGDLVIGASGYDVLYQPSQNRGAAFLVFGKKKGWTSIEDSRLIDRGVLLYEDEPSARSGYSVSMAGDLNGDGYGDLAVGSPYHSVSGFENIGRAYIIFGKDSGWGRTALTAASLATVEGLAGVPESNNIRLGYAVVGGNEPGMGDFNGDGYDDLVIGAPWTTQSGSTGWLMIVPGSYSGWTAKIKPTQLARLQGPTNHGIGSSLALAGHVGADGLVDLLVGSDYDVATSSGSSFFVPGDPSYIANAQITLSKAPEYYGTYSFDYVGDSISGQSDIDNDGRDDIFIGRKNAGSTTESNKNLAYVIFGADVMPTSGVIDSRASIRFTAGSDKLDECPCRVLGIGDMNGDGLGDFAVGVSRNDDNGKDAGKVYIFHGRGSRAEWGFTNGATQIDLPLDEADMAVVGESPDDQAGGALSRGDLNSDGLMDLVVGAPRWDGSSATNAGRVYIIFGAPAGRNSKPTG